MPANYYYLKYYYLLLLYYCVSSTAFVFQCVLNSGGGGVFVRALIITDYDFTKKKKKKFLKYFHPCCGVHRCQLHCKYNYKRNYYNTYSCSHSPLFNNVVLQNLIFGIFKYTYYLRPYFKFLNFLYHLRNVLRR